MICLRQSRLPVAHWHVAQQKAYFPLPRYHTDVIPEGLYLMDAVAVARTDSRNRKEETVQKVLYLDQEVHFVADQGSLQVDLQKDQHRVEQRNIGGILKGGNADSVAGS